MNTGMRAPWLRWGLVALAQIALIAVPLADRWSVHLSGTEVTLALRPVDPRDLLRGDYVILNPEIGRIARADITDTELDLSVGDAVWTVVAPDDDGIWRARDLLRVRPEDGRVAIAGRVERLRGLLDVDVTHGLDAFFVPEGEGLAIENLPRDELTLIVAVAQDGRSAPLRLVHDGQVLLRDTAF